MREEGPGCLEVAIAHAASSVRHKPCSFSDRGHLEPYRTCTSSACLAVRSTAIGLSISFPYLLPICCDMAETPCSRCDDRIVNAWSPKPAAGPQHVTMYVADDGGRSRRRWPVPMAATCYAYGDLFNGGSVALVPLPVLNFPVRDPSLLSWRPVHPNGSAGVTAIAGDRECKKEYSSWSSYRYPGCTKSGDSYCKRDARPANPISLVLTLPSDCTLWNVRPNGTCRTRAPTRQGGGPVNACAGFRHR